MKRFLFVFIASTIIVFSFGQNATYNSVLETGYWYKMAVSESGFYKLTYADLISMGFDPAIINPEDIRIYGNGGEMLPMPVNQARYDDIMENTIIVVGEEDNIFDQDDYILFYAQGPVTWKYNDSTQQFEHQINLYDDLSYYFITVDLGAGKRIEDRFSLEDQPTHLVSTYENYAFHELDEINLIQSGRQWFGEVFDETFNYDFNFSFPNIIIEKPITLKTGVLARSTVESTFDISLNGHVLINIPIPPVNTGGISVYARDVELSETFTANDENLSFTITYNKSTPESVGWLDHIAVNVSCGLAKSGHQTAFRNIGSVGQGNISHFTITNIQGDEEVFEITDPINIVRQIPLENESRDQIEFILETNHLREFILLDNSDLGPPGFIGPVENQNLHGFDGCDMIIITHLFLEDAALNLAHFHTENDDLNVIVVRTDQIYNEFSSGAQDITAIRDFVKMVYDRGQEKNLLPEYLLLFGDASYDYKARLENKTNLVPVYQTLESLFLLSSYPTDDYYACLEDGEGNWEQGFSQETLDLSVGRIPAISLTEAQGVINKIINYLNEPLAYANWRTKISYVADDEDNNMHMIQAENLASIAFGNEQKIDVEKNYFDYYFQINTPEGDRYPEATETLNKTIENGALIISYSGHNSDTIWGSEQVLTPAVINSWNNINSLPFFITGSGPFAPFDNPTLISGAEQILLKDDGGGIGIISSTRIGFSHAGFYFIESFFDQFFSLNNDHSIPAGTLYRNTKNDLLTENASKFTLLGDPAIRLSFPQNHIVTTHINGTPVGGPPDTIAPGSTIILNGYIADENGLLIEDFNGNIDVSFYDKIRTKRTKNNDGVGAFYFVIQDSLLFNGSFIVGNGEFDISFTLPTIMSEQYGQAKISYYADNYPEDAAGYFDDLVIGGTISGINHPDPYYNTLKLYPSITDGLVYIDLIDIVGSNASVQIHNINGKLLLNQKISTNDGLKTYNLDASHLPEGMYFVRLLTDKNIYFGKIIII